MRSVQIVALTLPAILLCGILALEGLQRPHAERQDECGSCEQCSESLLTSTVFPAATRALSISIIYVILLPLWRASSRLVLQRGRFVRMSILLTLFNCLSLLDASGILGRPSDKLPLLSATLLCSTVLSSWRDRADYKRLAMLLCFLMSLLVLAKHGRLSIHQLDSSTFGSIAKNISLGLSGASLLHVLDDSVEFVEISSDKSLEDSAASSARGTGLSKAKTLAWLATPQILLAVVFSLILKELSSQNLCWTILSSVGKQATSVFVLVSYLFFVDQDITTALVHLTVCMSSSFLCDSKASKAQIASMIVLYFCSWQSMQKRILPLKVLYTGILLLVVSTQLSSFRPAHNGEHALRSNAKHAYRLADEFEANERKITSLAEATLDYQSRYGRLPPPGFDIWFEYAQKHDALVLSNFDQIDRDLGPFWHIEPAEIRSRTLRAVQDRHNYISPLQIRSGQVSSPPMEIPTHYWLLEGLMEMMQDFVAFLPDMDIAINLNDEPRVLATKPMKAPRSYQKQGGPFTQDATFWPSQINFTDIAPESFTKIERQDQNTYKISTRFCPVRSLALANRKGVSRSGELISSETLQESLDICNQPQLESSRGFFVSPTNFDTTDELLPVFSQSKPSTFNDILLPSPWNFGDKVGKDVADKVPWKRKYDRLHWRGSSTEAWAVRGSWRHMLRQSMVDLLGGAKQESQPFTPTKVMIYKGDDEHGYRTMEMEVSELRKALDPDVFLVNIDRADDSEREAELEHFQLQQPGDFLQHWQYRYLLDLDGAAFSGRFLSFLESNSLPLKAPSVFTEWWSDRVFAYQHFVPISVDSVFAVWSYFVGLKDASGTIIIPDHQDEAEKIARAGQAWAAKTLTKTDMKLYLWRLLLEYGRVVDDNRAHIGYQHVT